MVHHPEDLKQFQALTTGNKKNAIIMGRKTLEGMPFLKHRDHLVLTNSMIINKPSC